MLRGTRLKSPRRVTFVDGDHNDRWCTKKVVDGFGLEGEPRPKSYVEVMIGTPRKVAFDDRGKFGLEGKIVRARAQSTKYEGVVSNTRGSSMCHGDGAMKNVSVVHQRSLGLYLE